MNYRLPQLDAGWFDHLGFEFEQAYMHTLDDFLQAESMANKIIYPPEAQLFSALNTTPLSNVKVVILGQDPYHGPNQAHGLSFSVPIGVKLPPSLKNIYKELAVDVGFKIPLHGCLQSWAEQGVLLLNSVLTVEQANAASHQGKGWERFTDRVIGVINEQAANVVFLLWGAYAHKKGRMIDRQRHLVLEAPHPSPLSAHRGFLGCKHFSQTNEYLESNGLDLINWQLAEPVTP